MEKIHKFVVVKKLMEEDDPDTEITTLYYAPDDEKREEVLKGDCYHDKIDDMIEDFFEGFDYAGVSYEITENGK